MPQLKKFIMTQDKSVCDILVASGFCLLNQVGNIYVFANTNNINFNFEEIDIKKLVYTDRLVF